MTSYIMIDTSFTFKLLIPHVHQTAYENQVQEWKLGGIQLCAPTLWAYELTSAFTKMVHFSQLSEANARTGLILAYQLGVELIEPDFGLSEKAFAWTRKLNRAAAYDSFYLALAEDRGAELWTADQRLVNATKLSWVRTLNI